MKETKYIESVYKYGRIWNLLSIVAFFIFPVVTALVFKAIPDWNGLWKGLLIVSKVCIKQFFRVSFI